VLDRDLRPAGVHLPHDSLQRESASGFGGGFGGLPARGGAAQKEQGNASPDELHAALKWPDLRRYFKF
jgi:hypothetical protein